MKKQKVLHPEDGDIDRSLFLDAFRDAIREVAAEIHWTPQERKVLDAARNGEEIVMEQFATRHANYFKYFVKISDAEMYEVLMPTRGEPWDAPVYVYPHEPVDAVIQHRYSSIRAFIAAKPAVFELIRPMHRLTKGQVEGRVIERKSRG
jgi:hypothetical protein